MSSQAGMAVFLPREPRAPHPPPPPACALTLSRALTWAPRLSSCLRMSRWPLRQAQNTGVLSSCKEKHPAHRDVWGSQWEVCCGGGPSLGLTKSRASTAAPASSSLFTSSQ